jgi:5S rRNA maturation endonuclease (ribonuclease M5)
VTLLIEVKNVRSWIYPSSGELYQLLSKACGVQHAAQEYGVLPVLVCRQAHPRTLWMGKDLGFFVVETGRQFVEKVSEDDVAEIRQALAFKDLIVVSPDYTSERIADRLTKVLPKIAVEFAERWKVTTKLLRTEIIDVHRSRNDAKKRFRAFMDLGAAAEGVGLRERDWYV